MSVAPHAIGSSRTWLNPPWYIFDEDSSTDEEPNQVASRAKIESHSGTLRSATKNSVWDSTPRPANRPTHTKTPIRSNKTMPSVSLPVEDNSVSSNI